MKKTATALLCAALMLTSAVPAFAAQAAGTTAAQAKATALAYVPSDSTLMKNEDDGDRYEVKFYSASYHEHYEIDVSKATGKMMSFDSTADNDDGGPTVTLTEAAAKKIVTDEIKNIKNITAYVKWDDGLAEYHVGFTTENAYGEYSLHPQSGRILERDITMALKTTAAAGAGTTATAGATAAGTYITAEKAASLGLAQVNGTVTDVDLDYKGGRAVYEVEVYKDYIEYDFVFDAVTGSLISSKSEHDDDFVSHYATPPASGSGATASKPAATASYIGVERAKQIALAKASAGTVVRECKLDYEDGRPVYEGELRNGFWECDFEIDAESGVILKWDAEYDD